MPVTTIDTSTVTDHIDEAVRAATRAMAPVWPLERFVAVNPYLGMADRGLDQVADRLARVAGARSTLPASWYLDAVASGRISRSDVAAALGRRRPAPAAGVDELLQLATTDGGEVDRVPTLAEVASTVTGLDWERLATERVSAWAAAYFDGGQATWRSTAPTDGPFAAWRFEAAIDRTPEVMGLRGFRTFVRGLPDDPSQALRQALAELDVPDAGLELYLHRLLFRVGGWAAHAARLRFEAERDGGVDDSIDELLAVLACWEQGVQRCVPAPGLAPAWHEARIALHDLAVDDRLPDSLAIRLVLHEAFEAAEQRRLASALAGGGAAGRVPSSDAPHVRPSVQTVSCIDVRSEVLRRHLETVADGVETVGFAGFFGFAIEHVPLGLEHGRAQAPVLLSPGHVVRATLADDADHDRAVATRHLRRHVRKAWKSFKMGAISCFSFVGPVGLAYLPKLFTDAAGRTRPVPHPDVDSLPGWARGDRAPLLRAETIPLAARIDLAEGALRGMSLTGELAPLVVLAGHGATTVNNPYDSGLACGACGGHSGEANARVAAAVFNDPAVRDGLVERGITIPDDTWFVAAQHDTTTDDVAVFDRHLVPAGHADLLAELEGALAEAGRRARRERAPRLGIVAEGGAGDTDHAAIDDAVRRMSTDWAQVRPEWGLAGCRAFIAAPRHRTAGVDLEGRAFLHSYDWRADEGFGVLEVIMTAPMVVASWISLQYFASTVDNEVFGSGNKTLHNVVGRLGVVEGTAGDLRVGLPWQSVHDGERHQHEPVRLTVVIEAPTEAMNDVLCAHPGVRALCDNGWVQLHAMGDDGTVTARYAGDLRWEDVTGASSSDRVDAMSHQVA